MLSLVLLASILSLNPLPEQKQADGLDSTKLVSLTPVWTTGIFTEQGGQANIFVTDLNKDGISDILSCSNGHIYFLNHTPDNQYIIVWYSDNIGCKKITLADRDANPCI